jgi:hypothetical protein
MCITFFAEVPITRSATTANYALASQGQILPLTGTVYWSSSFETGTFSDFSGGGTIQDVSAPYVTSTIVTSPVFKGKYACKSAVVTPPSSGIVRAKSIEWNPMRNMPEAYFGAALYLPANFNVGPSNWVNIMQLHCMSDSASGLPACIIMTKSNGILKMNLYQQTASGQQIFHWTGNAILGQWFTIVIYCNFVQNGHCSLWINGNLVFNQDGDYRTGDTTYVGAFFDTGIYQNYDSPAQYVISDDMICASTLSLATPVA